MLSCKICYYHYLQCISLCLLRRWVSLLLECIQSHQQKNWRHPITAHVPLAFMACVRRRGPLRKPDGWMRERLRSVIFLRWRRKLCCEIGFMRWTRIMQVPKFRLCNLPLIYSNRNISSSLSIVRALSRGWLIVSQLYFNFSLDI